MRNCVGIVCLSSAFGLSLLASCHSADTDSRSSDATRTVTGQIARGSEVFGMHCAACHGGSGEGTQRAPALVGLAQGALPKVPRPGSARTTEFRTAMDIAVFVTQNMPPTESKRKPIAEDDYWAVLAFALSANGATPNEVVGPHNAATFVVHP